MTLSLIPLNLTKILVAVLYDEKKEYCANDFFERLIDILMTTKYNYELLIIDSTNNELGKGRNHLLWIKIKEKIGNKIKVIHSPKREKELSKQIITRNQNIARDEILKDSGAGFTHLLFIETDVFSPKTINGKNPIDLLVEQQKDIIGYPTPYFNSLTIFEIIDKNENKIHPTYSVRAYNNNEETIKNFIEIYPDKVCKCKGIGFGFTLIRKELLYDVCFRYNQQHTYHSDVFFSYDLISRGIDIWFYLEILEHRHKQVIDIA